MPTIPSHPPDDSPRPTPVCTNAHVDGCPKCVVNSEMPVHVERRPDGCEAFYRCTDCGHEWPTSWGCR